MRRLLHILTRHDYPLPARLAHWHGQHKEWHTLTVDLTQPKPDYDDLLDKIFEADSVQVE